MNPTSQKQVLLFTERQIYGCGTPMEMLTEPLQLFRKHLILWEALPGLGQRGERGKSKNKDNPSHVPRVVYSSEKPPSMILEWQDILCSIKRVPHGITGWSQHLFYSQNIKEQPSSSGFHGEIPSSSLEDSASLGLLQPHTCPGHTLPSQATFPKSGLGGAGFPQLPIPYGNNGK